MNKLQAVRYEAAYAQIAQKFDMHIKNFDSDHNTQIRWVWQLIQNAKDAPNVFKQTKIKQQVDDYYFISKHNGDAFQINQLHSVVAQYSTKKQKNSELTKTTGKYGTGFITTYILSKILELEGILKVEIDNESDDEQQNQQDQDSEQNSDDLQNQDLQQKIYRKLLRKIKSQKQKPSKFKNNQKICRLIKSQLKSKSLMGVHSKKSSQIRKQRKNKDLERMKNKLIFQKQFERLKIQEEIQYDKEMKLLSQQLAGLSTGDDNELKQFQNRTNFHKKQKKQKNKKNKKSIFYYKKFTIPMDRSYTDRDQQLPKKIEKTQKRLTKIVVQAEYQSTHNPDYSTGDYYTKKRTSDSYDTIFKYKLVDKKKYQMIERTMVNVKQLIPYALLFNDNLTYYEFIDKRKITKQNLSFSVTKGGIDQIGPNIFLFTYQVQENYDLEKEKFLINRIQYFVSYFAKGKAIAAIPVRIQENSIQILRVDSTVPKYFKDFPLIGCSDTKWNAIINAREFYPNQTRSQLMLKYKEQQNRSKVQMNWIHLYACFNAVKQIYIFLSHHCLVGLQNLLIFSSDNLLAIQRVEFRAHLTTLIRQISQTKFIPNRTKDASLQKNNTQPRHLVFIQLAYKNQEIYNKDVKQHYEMSYKANEAFSFLYGQNVTLSSQHYKGFYSILNYKSNQRQYLQSNSVLTFVSVNDCLRKMQSLSFQDFCIKLKRNYLDQLHDIYSLLKKYNQPVYLSLSKVPCLDFKIMLSQKMQFMRLRQNNMMFNSLPNVYHELADKLGIPIKQNLIHKQFAQYVRQTKDIYHLDIIKMQNRIVDHFKKYTISFKDDKKIAINGLNNLKKMFQFLQTFKSLSNESINLIKKFTEFQKVESYSFKQNIKQLHKLRQPIQKQIINLFVNGFMIYFQYMVRYTPIIKDQLGKSLLIKSQQEAIAFMKILFIDKYVGNSLGLITMKMDWSGVFVQESTLYKLNQNVKYPDFQDIQIYNIGYTYMINKQANEFNFHKLKLETRLVHPIYPRTSLTKIKAKQYGYLYSGLISNYYKHYSVTQQQKYQILSYASQINDKYKSGVKVDATIKEKYQAWKTQIETRLNKLFELKSFKKQFDNEQKKNFIYKLLDNKQELMYAQMIFQNNGGKLYFRSICQQLKLINSDQKKEQQKNIKK